MFFKKDIKHCISLFTFIDALLTIYGLTFALNNDISDNYEPILICNIAILIIWLINYNNNGFQEKIDKLIESDIDVDDIDDIKDNINYIFFPYTAIYGACTIYIFVLLIMNHYNYTTINNIWQYIIINDIICGSWFVFSTHIKNMLWDHINESYESLV
jgi:hypothetical protein